MTVGSPWSCSMRIRSTQEAFLPAERPREIPAMAERFRV